eukprot:NODE_3351_length_940_cov_4.768799_g2793_i0.p4 GENE.NODE_3351_length_940_cov_4.768799_g2793_i0~~NODE_3351_length_940_cov_4.768799_g2793_i0.p4  ORF type:complete len:106 (+),score=9.37 NODE_3351_length_940_cov_4.768799_g2793_i0:506-823(+)
MPEILAQPLRGCLPNGHRSGLLVQAPHGQILNQVSNRDKQVTRARRDFGGDLEASVHPARTLARTSRRLLQKIEGHFPRRPVCCKDLSGPLKLLNLCPPKAGWVP